MSSTGNAPLFRTVQLRQIPFLPHADAASICTAGSQSRVGCKRIKNVNVLPLDCAVESTQQGGVDPLKLPNSRRDELNQIVYKKSMEEMKV